MFEISNLPLTALGAGLILFQALLACWFTKGAFEVEEGRALPTGAFLRFVGRFLWTTVLLYAAFGAAAFLLAFLLSVFVFPDLRRLPRRSSSWAPARCGPAGVDDVARVRGVLGLRQAVAARCVSSRSRRR